MTVQQLARKYGIQIVSERVAVKRARVLDGRQKADTEQIPGAPGWITATSSGRSRMLFLRDSVPPPTRRGSMIGATQPPGMRNLAALVCEARDHGPSVTSREEARARLWRLRWAPEMGAGKFIGFDTSLAEIEMTNARIAVLKF